MKEGLVEEEPQEEHSEGPQAFFVGNLELADCEGSSFCWCTVKGPPGPPTTEFHLGNITDRNTFVCIRRFKGGARNDSSTLATPFSELTWVGTCHSITNALCPSVYRMPLAGVATGDLMPEKKQVSEVPSGARQLGLALVGDALAAVGASAMVAPFVR